MPCSKRPKVSITAHSILPYPTLFTGGGYPHPTLFPPASIKPTLTRVRPSATSRLQAGSNGVSGSTSVPSSHSTRSTNAVHPSQVSAYLHETDSYRAFLCQGPQGNGTGHIPSFNANSHAGRDQPENHQYHSHVLVLARGRTLHNSQSTPCYDQLDLDHRASPCDGSNSGEASPQYNVLGQPHCSSTQFGHNSDQSSHPYGVPGGSAQFQNPGSFCNAYPPHMVATSRNAPKPMVERGILDDSYGPPPYEVATRSRAMAQFVQDWSADWDRMEPGRGNVSGDARDE